MTTTFIPASAVPSGSSDKEEGFHPSSEANVPRTAQASQAKAISTGTTADTRQAQINEEGEAEETAELTEGGRYGKQD
jgi:hypothetical protein